MRLGKTAFCVVLVLIWFLFLHPRHTTVLSETLLFCFGIFVVVVALGLICSRYFVAFFPYNNLRCCVRLIDLFALMMVVMFCLLRGFVFLFHAAFGFSASAFLH